MMEDLNTWNFVNKDLTSQNLAGYRISCMQRGCPSSSVGSNRCENCTCGTIFVCAIVFSLHTEYIMVIPSPGQPKREVKCMTVSGTRSLFKITGTCIQLQDMMITTKSGRGWFASAIIDVCSRTSSSQILLVQKWRKKIQDLTFLFQRGGTQDVRSSK